MKRLVLAVLLLLPGLAAAQGFEASLTPATNGSDYPAIEFMSAGASSALPSAASAEDLPPASPQAQALRVVVYRSEVYQSLVIETLTTGLEGCCSVVAERRSVDLGAFAKHFGFKGEVGGFVFVGWSSPQSFRFTYQGKPFVATVDGGRVRMDRDK
jgi:hypothetical protein